jgi:hypothetical protein
MALEKESVVRARLDGVDDVASGFGKIGQSGAPQARRWPRGSPRLRGSSRTPSKTSSATFGHVVTAAGAINFAGAVAQAHQLEDAVARACVASHRSFRSVGEPIDDLSGDMNELPTG